MKLIFSKEKEEDAQQEASQEASQKRFDSASSGMECEQVESIIIIFICTFIVQCKKNISKRN